MRLACRSSGRKCSSPSWASQRILSTISKVEDRDTFSGSGCIEHPARTGARRRTKQRTTDARTRYSIAALYNHDAVPLGSTNMAPMPRLVAKLITYTQPWEPAPLDVLAQGVHPVFSTGYPQWQKNRRALNNEGEHGIAPRIPCVKAITHAWSIRPRSGFRSGRRGVRTGNGLPAQRLRHGEASLMGGPRRRALEQAYLHAPSRERNGIADPLALLLL